jgi:flagellar FliL protein
LRDFTELPRGGNKGSLTIFAGKIFLPPRQKKGSINHCDLALTATGRWCAGGICIASLACLAASSSSPNPGGQVMADSDQDDVAGSDAVAAPKSKLKLIVAAAALLVLAGGGATWFFFFRGHAAEEVHADAAPKPPVFVEVPDMLVNLSGLPGERVQYLKLKIVLEVKEEKQVEAIKPSMPRVTDLFQGYMRELRAADLNGSAGLFRLKEELTRRVNAAIAPSQVTAVLFKEIVVQ